MLRIKIVAFLIEINEKIFFYPKLRKALHSFLPQKPFILDVGANKGQSIDFFISIRPTSSIISFEPVILSINTTHNITIRKYYMIVTAIKEKRAYIRTCKSSTIYKSSLKITYQTIYSYSRSSIASRIGSIKKKH